MHYLLRDFLDIMTSMAITLGVIFSYFQIKKISKSIEIGQKANTINVLNSFTKEYDEIMIKAMDCDTTKKLSTWYFRFWNLITNEFLFFSKGLLDSYIFEFWAYKMCLYYNEKPTTIPLKRVCTYQKAHQQYIDGHNGNYPKTDAFFKELMKIANKEKDEIVIRKKVHLLIKKYNKR